MKIIRLEDRIGESTVDGERIGKLPLRLLILMRNLMANLKGIKSITIALEPKSAVFELAGRNVSISSLGKKKRELFLRIVPLLLWYKKEHWYRNNPDLIGGTIYCSECHSGFVLGSIGIYCPNAWCPSHKKWQEIIGPSYKPPENPMINFLEKAESGNNHGKKKALVLHKN